MDRVLRWVPFAVVLATGAYLNDRAPHLDAAVVVAEVLLLGVLWATVQIGRGRYH